jgi:hypothetical protein
VNNQKTFLVLFFLTIFIGLPSVEAASTYSFTNTPERGTYPEALKLNKKKITVDLSTLQQGTKVFRAILVPHRKGNTFHYSWNGAEKQQIKIEDDATGTFLRLRAPDYLTFDATKAVQNALSHGRKMLTLNVHFPFLGHPDKALYLDNKTGKPVIRLDVTTNLPSQNKIPPVSDIHVMHRSGGTMIHWKEPLPLANSTQLSCEQFINLRKQQNNPHEIRYRIYRHNRPVTAETIINAELVGETDPLSVWNWLYFAHKINFEKHRKVKNIPRYPIDDGKLADFDMGIYVHNVQEAADHSYYAVSRVIDGAENLESLELGKNSTDKSVSESPGTGLVLLRHKTDKKKWHYVEGTSTLRYFVKWEAPPRFSRPEPFNYLVVEPEAKYRKKRPPLSVALHAWGGSINGGWLWSYNMNKYGAIHVSTNQYPYDWWTGYHENLWTLKPLTSEAGQIRPYTQRRIRSFIDHFVIPKWHVDTERILLHGNSMGGAGTSLWGIKAGQYFSNLTGMVGVHIPAETPQFVSSFYDVYGAVTDNIEYNDSGMSAWDYEDNVRWLKDNITVETPHISFSNGKNDGGIGWPQAWKFTKALIETKRPFVFKWGMGGHGERPYHIGNNIDFQLHQSLPAFSGGTLDDNIGDSPDAGAEKGQINYFYLWETNSITDTPDQWGMSIYLRKDAVRDYAEVNLTPRRLQQFAPQIGKAYRWRNMQAGKVVQKGVVIANEYGLITLPTVLISKNHNRITISKAEDGAVEEPPSRLLPSLLKTTEDLSPSPVKKSPPAPLIDLSAPAKKVSVSNIKELFQVLSRLQSNTTILLEDGVYLLPKTISIGAAWSENTQPIQKITLMAKRGAQGKVVLAGPGMNQNREPKILIRVKYSRGVTFKYISLKDAYFHLLQVHGEDDADGVHLDHVTLLDAGQQLIKISRSSRIKRFADNGLIENSTIAFTDHARYSPDVIGGAYYTNGIDVLGGSDWVIRNNTFRNIRAPHDGKNPKGLAGSAVLMWHQTKNTIVENNRFYECDIGITFGLTAGETPDHMEGVIQNNYIYRKGPGDVGISLNETRDVKVLDNTVLLHQTFPWTIEERRIAHDTKKPALIKGNCTDGPIILRDRGIAELVENTHDCSKH